MLLLKGAACLLKSALLWGCSNFDVRLAHNVAGRAAEDWSRRNALNLQGGIYLTQVMAAESST